MDDCERTLHEQIAYYRARAGEYDRWFFRAGRYDRGPRENARWFAEIAEVADALRAFDPAGEVLELAGGTGLWTERLLDRAARVTVVDASPEVLELNALRTASSGRTEYVEADIFEWKPSQRYDAVFFSFWLSHVPLERFAAFWGIVRAALEPKGRVFLIDSLRTERSTAIDHRLPGASVPTLTRRLDDGREFRIFKHFYTAQTLGDALRAQGWSPALCQTDEFFLYGSAVPI